MYEESYARSLNDPEGFWGDAANDVHWFKWDRVLDRKAGVYGRWFVGGVTNTCYNALDRHVERGRGDQAALIYDSPLTNTVRSFTYRELRDQVARFAGALTALGVKKGDRVIIYMPMVPETVVAMLACARIGAVHSVVFGGFAANELSKRIADAKPKVIVSASCGLEPGRTIAYKPMLDEAIELSPFKPKHCVILQRPQVEATMIAGRDLDWNDVNKAATPVDCVPVEATDPLYILYTSGTTGHSERRDARQRRTSRRAEVEHEERLRHRAGRSVLVGVGHGLGRRPLVHRLRRRSFMDARRFSTKANRSALPIPARSGA